MKPIGVAVIGAGYWGPNLVRNFLACPEVDLCWVADLDRERAVRAVGRRSTVRVTDDLGAVLSDDRVDAVAVATPAWTHFEVALACLRGGQARPGREAARVLGGRGREAGRRPPRAAAWC